MCDDGNEVSGDGCSKTCDVLDEGNFECYSKGDYDDETSWPEELKNTDSDTVCRALYPETEYEIEQTSSAVNYGAAVQTVVQYSINSLEFNPGPGAWASVNFLQLARLSVLMTDSNDTTTLFLAEAATFSVWSFGFTTDMVKAVFEPMGFEKLDPDPNMERYGIRTADFTLFMCEQVILFLFIVVVFVILLLFSAFLRKIDKKRKVW